jgi:ATP-dependent DNA ligase
MLARLADALPVGDGWIYEPKWDGFRALVFKDGDAITLQSRELRPLQRYFPELEAALRAQLPDRCVLDGEIVLATGGVLDFDALQLRIHSAASRVAMLSEKLPCSFVAWDLLCLGEQDLRAAPQAERRAALERALAAAAPPVHVTPITRSAEVAADWFQRFEGAGLDGVMAKPIDLPYQAGKRAMLKIKHARTADVVVAGFRWHKDGPGTLVGSLVLGLYDVEGVLHHVGVASSFKRAERESLAVLLEPLREGAKEVHPWGGGPGDAQRRPGARSRWSRGKDLSWQPLRIERVAEVGYDHMQGTRFRHPTHFKRWRLDRSPAACRYDQLEVTAPYELAAIFGTLVRDPAAVDAPP